MTLGGPIKKGAACRPYKIAGVMLIRWSMA
jgi:hypothetical protein